MFECHITIDPVSLEERPKLEALVSPVKFKLANLLMMKNDGTPGEPSTIDTFMTTQHVKLWQVKERMKEACGLLIAAGYTLKRAKIESILFDTKCGDIVAFRPETNLVALCLRTGEPY